MQSHSIRYTLGWALVLTAAWFAIAFVLTDAYQDASIQEMALTALLFFAIIFFTMRLTNRITLWLGKRMGVEPRAPGERRRRGAAPEAPEPLPSTTDRPEHAARRRQRRRRRGARARRE